MSIEGFYAEEAHSNRDTSFGLGGGSEAKLRRMCVG